MGAKSGAALALALSLLGSIVHAEYAPPEAPPGTLLLETFQGKIKDLGWVQSDKDKYEGEFKLAEGSKVLIEGDTGLFAPEKAQHYAIAKPVDVPATSEKDVVFQYQVRYDEYPTCGGAYLKFILAPFSDLEEWDDQVPYSVMFGPDKCGTESKVHFIMQQKNPNTGKMVEHHLVSPPQPAIDKNVHLYTLAVYTNQSFALFIDNNLERHGSLLTEFEPPVQPPKLIDDPHDTKPEDWVDAEEIEDEDAVKPDDWDESAPMMIPDRDAVKPDDWLDDEPEDIPDPNETKPDDWDDEKDGVWEQPMIENPKCVTKKCGEWKPEKVKNPAYKGKWKKPMIPNPAYNGEWKPKQIGNPDYYEVTDVHVQPISAVGVEIWTMDKGYTFDNILIADNLEAAQEFAKGTFDIIKVKQEEMGDEELEELKKADNFYDEGPDYGADYGEDYELADDEHAEL